MQCVCVRLWRRVYVQVYVCDLVENSKQLLRIPTPHALAFVELGRSFANVLEAG